MMRYARPRIAVAAFETTSDLVECLFHLLKELPETGRYLIMPGTQEADEECRAVASARISAAELRSVTFASEPSSAPGESGPVAHRASTNRDWIGHHAAFQIGKRFGDGHLILFVRAEDRGQEAAAFRLLGQSSKGPVFLQDLPPDD